MPASSPAPVIQGTQSPHEIDSESGAIDEEGVATASVTYRVMTVLECATYNPGSHALGIPLITRNWILLTGGLGYNVTFNYEGKMEIDPDDADAGQNEYDMDMSFGEDRSC